MSRRLMQVGSACLMAGLLVPMQAAGESPVFPDPQVLTYSIRTPGGMTLADRDAQNAPRILWEERVPQDVYYRILQQELSPPVILGDKLLVPSARHSGILVYDRHSGALMDSWATDANIETELLRHGDVFYVADSKGNIYQFSQDGEQLWKSEVGEGIQSNLTIDSGNLYYHTLNGQIGALNAKTGELIWSYTRTAVIGISILGGSSVQGSGDWVYVGFADGAAAKLAARSGTVQWEVPIANPDSQWRDTDIVKLLDDSCFFVSSYEGPSMCLSPENGQISWTNDVAALAEPMLVGNLLVIASLDGLVSAVNRDSGETVWTWEAPKSLAANANRQALTTPQLWHGSVLVGSSRGLLFALEPTTGELDWTFKPWIYSYGFHHRPVVKDDSLYMLSNGGYLYHMVTEDYVAPNLITNRSDWIMEAVGADIREPFQPAETPVAQDTNGRTGELKELNW